MKPCVLFMLASSSTAKLEFNSSGFGKKDDSISVRYNNCRTRFTSRRPFADNVCSILFGTGNSNSLGSDISFRPRFNHDSVGITEALPLVGDPCAFKKEETTCSSEVMDGWRVLKFRRRIGHGQKYYTKLCSAAFNWVFECRVGNRCMGILPVAAGKDTTKRTLLATFTEMRLPRPLKSIFVVSPIHVVQETRDEQLKKCTVSSTSYATLQGHLLAGEERVTIIWRKCMDNEVDVEIASCSRAAPSLRGKIVWPFIGRMQKQFFLAEMEHLIRTANCGYGID